jgi:hypothetical protein
MAQKPDLAKREVWRKRLRDFARGNRTIGEFCRHAGVPVWSFYYWRHRLDAATSTPAPDLRRNGTATRTRTARFVERARAGSPPKLNFVPIQITGPRHVEVQLPDGTRVTVPCQERDAIAAVVAALVREPAVVAALVREPAVVAALRSGPREGRPC